MQIQTKTDTEKQPVATAPAPATAKAKAAPKPKADATAADRETLAKQIAADRDAAAALFNKLSAATVSIPVKPVAAYRKAYRRDVPPHAIGRNPSVRQAAAIAVGALAGGKTIKNGITFKRAFNIRGAEYVIENGALADMQRAGLASYDSDREALRITNAAQIASLIGTVTKLPK